jgi:hypothetical protein
LALRAELLAGHAAGWARQAPRADASLACTLPPSRPDLQGAKKTLAANDDGWTNDKSLWIAAICAAGLAALTAAIAVPILWKRLEKQFA